MNTCPKCGSPQASELTTSGFTLQKKAMWFGCGSHVLLDEPEKILSRTNQCRDQEEINDLRRKVEEDAERIRELEEQIKVKEFLLNEALREALRVCVWWAESVSRRITEDRESINWTGLQQARKALADIEKEEK